MKAAYADPPYKGSAKKHYARLHDQAADYDTLEAHKDLIERLCSEFDGWALSMSSTNLRETLPLCPEGVRIGAWVKPFAVFKNVDPAYCWEPVIFSGIRKRGRSLDYRTKRDWVSSNITLKRNTPGAKPDAFCWWVFDFLGLQPEDEFHDLFPGSGAVSRAWEHYRRCLHKEPLFAGLDEIA